jgi:iron(III) transport system permease protein
MALFKDKRTDLEKQEGFKFGLEQGLTLTSVILLAVIVVIPVAMIILNTFWDADGHLDLATFWNVIVRSDNLKAIRNTVFISFSATIGCALIGVFFAWLLGRSDIPAKGLMRTLFSIPFMIPPFLGAMCWDLMFSGRGGYINKLLMSLFSLESPPIEINSIGGIIFVEIIYFFSFVYLQVISSLERMDPTLEESARIAGANQMYVIRKITLPLMIPSISAGVLLVLISTLSHYGVPSILGFSQNIYTLPTKIVERMYAANGSFEGIREATALSILLVVIVAIGLVVQRAVLNVGRYDIIKGKSMRPTLIKLRGARIPLFIISLVFLAFVVIVPLVVLVLVSFLKAYGLPIIRENFSVVNYVKVFSQKSVIQAIKNSLFLSVSAGVICLFLGVMVAYVVYKVKPRGRGLIEMLAVLPYSLPGTVLSIGVILAWSGKIFGIKLYNTIWIILVAYCARYLSYTLKSSASALQQVHYSLEEASRSCGATKMRALLDITLPLIRPAMVSGFFMVFLPAMRELTTSVLLYGPKSRTLGVQIYQLRDNGYMCQASALAAVTIVIIIVSNKIVEFITKDRKGV